MFSTIRLLICRMEYADIPFRVVKSSTLSRNLRPQLDLAAQEREFSSESSIYPMAGRPGGLRRDECGLEDKGQAEEGALGADVDAEFVEAASGVIVQLVNAIADI